MKNLIIVLLALMPLVATAQINPHENKGAGATVPAYRVIEVSKDNNFRYNEPCRAVWVGGEGNLTVETWNGETVTIVGVQTGSLLPIAVRRVLTDTTATSIQLWY
jgi:hypothetical protein